MSFRPTYIQWSRVGIHIIQLFDSTSVRTRLDLVSSIRFDPLLASVVRSSPNRFRFAESSDRDDFVLRVRERASRAPLSTNDRGLKILEISHIPLNDFLSN